MDILAPKVRLPRVASLPGSPAQGDAVVLTTDGLLYVYDGSAWVAAGLSSELPGGVLSTSLSDSYATSGAVAGGANNFFVMAIVMLTETRNNAKVEPIINSQSTGTSGWHLSIGYGAVLSGVYVNTYGLQAASIPAGVFDPHTRSGEVLAIGAYFWGASAGTIVATDLWVGPARCAQTAGGGVGAVVVNTTTALKVLDGSFFGTFGGGCGEAEVWQEAMGVLEDGKAVPRSSLVGAVTSAFDVEPSVAEEDVSALVSSLEREGLVDVARP